MADRVNIFGPIPDCAALAGEARRLEHVNNNLSDISSRDSELLRNYGPGESIHVRNIAGIRDTRIDVPGHADAKPSPPGVEAPRPSEEAPKLNLTLEEYHNKLYHGYSELVYGEGSVLTGQRIHLVRLDPSDISRELWHATVEYGTEPADYDPVMRIGGDERHVYFAYDEEVGFSDIRALLQKRKHSDGELVWSAYPAGGSGSIVAGLYIGTQYIYMLVDRFSGITPLDGVLYQISKVDGTVLSSVVLPFFNYGYTMYTGLYGLSDRRIYVTDDFTDTIYKFGLDANARLYLETTGSLSSSIFTDMSGRIARKKAARLRYAWGFSYDYSAFPGGSVLTKKDPRGGATLWTVDVGDPIVCVTESRRFVYVITQDIHAASLVSLDQNGTILVNKPYPLPESGLDAFGWVQNVYTDTAS